MIYSSSAPSGELYTDHLENIYFIDSHKLIKIETRTGNMLEYGSLPAGAISSADVSNPFQIMIFYRDFNQVVFLDNKLALLPSPISFSDLGIEQVILACTSGSGGFWVFSDLNNQLVYFDQQLRNSHQGMIISSITRSNKKPVYMIEAQNQLYLHVPGEGILVFDRFASYLKTIPYSGPERFQVLDGRIIYFLDGELLSLNLETGLTRSYLLPSGEEIDDAHLQHKRLYLLSGERISLFRIQ